MKGFTLIELLAVILILAIITTLSIPVVGKIIDEKKIETVYIDAKTILREIEYDNIETIDFPRTLISNLSISSVSLANYNTTSSYIYVQDDEFYIVLIGANKFLGINACNIKQSSADDNVGRITCP